MKIAVASQNRHTITEHAGRCRKFWIYQIAQNKILHKDLLELPKDQSFHESPPHAPHPLDDAQILIAGSMGQGLRQRLAMKGIIGLVTPETDPDQAVSAYLAGTLPIGIPEPHAHGGREHHHRHEGHGHH
ncbi:MAG TPA: NifB/NifX family molybdenum-iron cluster-binding protein [Candidatus Competibacteraceae bacterium]|nr:NifB/NifX family molybdenum-iron cluster-binding protein [Candidatus Competibacteraceae bacterium]